MKLTHISGYIKIFIWKRIDWRRSTDIRKTDKWSGLRGVSREKYVGWCIGNQNMSANRSAISKKSFIGGPCSTKV